MRTRRAVIVCAIALGLLMGSSISTFAQSVAEEREERAAWVREHERGGIFVPTPVLDSPFSGQAVTTWRPPSNTGRHEVRPPPATTAIERGASGWNRRSSATRAARVRTESSSLPISTPSGLMPWTLSHERP
jgi:hypothetical protein